MTSKEYERICPYADNHVRRAHHVIHHLAKGEPRKHLAPVLIALEVIAPTVEWPGAALRALEMIEKDHNL